MSGRATPMVTSRRVRQRTRNGSKRGSEPGIDQCFHESSADLDTIHGVDQLAVLLRLHDR